MKDWTSYGTRIGLDFLSKASILPTRNCWTGSYDKAKDIDHYFRTRSKGRGVPCGDYCLTPCSTFSQVTEGPWSGENCEGPEYESIYALGSSCMVADARALVPAQGRCDDWGMDNHVHRAHPELRHGVL